MRQCGAVPSGLFGGPNLMTPRIVEMGRLPSRRLYYEISTDDGDWHSYVEHGDRSKPLIGVTIRTASGQDPDGLSCVFRSLTEAEAYLDNLEDEDAEPTS